MTARIFRQPVLHRVDHADADPRLLWTICDIRFCWDPPGYRRAQRVLGLPEPSGHCGTCFG